MFHGFKVWDDKNKLWFCAKNSFINHKGKLVHAIPLPVDGYKMDELGPDENLIPVFSTGKKDKNGTELYFGDRVNDFGIELFISEETDARWTIDIDKLNDPMSRVEKIGSKYEVSK